MENLTFSVYDNRKGVDNPEQCFRGFLHKCYIKTKGDFGVEVFRHRLSQASNNSHAVTNLATLIQDRQLRPFYTPESTALASVLVQTTIILHNFHKIHTIHAISLSSFLAHIAHLQPTLKLSVLYILTAPNLGKREILIFSGTNKANDAVLARPWEELCSEIRREERGAEKMQMFYGGNKWPETIKDTVGEGRNEMGLEEGWKRVGYVTERQLERIRE